MELLYLQLKLFIASVVSGILLLFFYDFLRIYRVVSKHGKIRIFIEDYLFWMASGFVIFLMLYQFNNGAIRSFAILGIALGMWGYHCGPSTLWVRFISRILKWLISLWKSIWRILMKPFCCFFRFTRKLVLWGKRHMFKVPRKPLE